MRRTRDMDDIRQQFASLDVAQKSHSPPSCANMLSPDSYDTYVGSGRKILDFGSR
jgi:hypothetical protein